MNIIYKEFNNDFFKDIFLVSENNLIKLFKPGKNSYEISDFEWNSFVGIYNFNSKNIKIKTDGLKWNLNNEMEYGFGNLLSTSNKII